MPATTSLTVLGTPAVERCEPISTEEFGFVRSHPALPDAVATFSAGLIRNYNGNALLNMLLCDRGRVLVGLMVAYLDVVPTPGSGARGATVGGVQMLCRQTGLCSAGRAASVLAAMRFGGYVILTDDPDDRRRRLLRPTPKLTGRQVENWSRQFEAMEPILPESASVPEALRRPAFRTGFLDAIGSHYLGGFRLLERARVLEPMVESNAGLLILVSLVMSVLVGEARAGEAVPLSISALSRRFCISRAHVRKLLAGAEAAGLVAGGRDANRIVVLKLLVDAVLSFHAALFALFARCAAMAARDERRWTDGAVQPVGSGDAQDGNALWRTLDKRVGTNAGRMDQNGRDGSGDLPGHGNGLRANNDGLTA